MAETLMELSSWVVAASLICVSRVFLFRRAWILYRRPESAPSAGHVLNLQGHLPGRVGHVRGGGFLEPQIFTLCSLTWSVKTVEVNQTEAQQRSEPKCTACPPTPSRLGTRPYP